MASMEKIDRVLADERAQLWINHDKRSSGTHRITMNSERPASCKLPSDA
jgi:hypothetical protein